MQPLPSTHAKYQYKLLSVTMNDGTVLRPGRLTVLVGPNNVGKSRVLKEITAKTTSHISLPSVIVSAITVNYPSTLTALRDAYNIDRHQDDTGSWVFRGLTPMLNQEYSISGPNWPMWYEQTFNIKINHYEKQFTEHFGREMVAFLTTESRLQIVHAGDSPAHHREASSLLQLLYNAGSEPSKSISNLVKSTFNREIALDFTIPRRLLLRVGDDFSSMPIDPRDARSLMQKCELLDEQGDGIRSFVGISVALLILNRPLFLIDEPEAFLHPPQAYRIGAFIADQANLSRQIVIATHSVDVLRGILSRTQDVDIVRVDRIGNTNSFYHLAADRLKGIINDPLLTSARVLDGLFYPAAVVVEADSDARFYHAASARQAPRFDLHFVNADNKQTVPRIVRLYQDMGVRAAGIVDFDVLNDRAELEKSLQTLGFPHETLSGLLEAQRQIGHAAKELPPDERLNDVRAKLGEILLKIDKLAGQVFSTVEENVRAKDSLLRQLESRLRELAEMTKAWKALKQSGRAALSPDAAGAFDRIRDACAARGFFINPIGELESMLTDYGIKSTTDKKGWITQALQLVTSLEPDHAKYPWTFLQIVHTYLQSVSPTALSCGGVGVRGLPPLVGDN